MAYKRKEPADTAGKTETFFTRHVRLITFLICIAVFLVTFVPLALWGPVNIFDLMRSCTEQETRVEMTVEDLESVAAKNKYLSIRDLDRFVSETSSGEQSGLKYVVYQIDVGDRYLLTASFNEASGMVYYLTLTDLETDAYLDLLEDYRDLDEFLASGETEE